MKRTNIIGALCCAGLAWAVLGIGSGADIVTAPYTGNGAAVTVTVPGNNEGAALHPVAQGRRIAQATRKASTKKSPPPQPAPVVTAAAPQEDAREEEVVVPVTPGGDVVNPVTPTKPVVHRRKKPAIDSTKAKTERGPEYNNDKQGAHDDTK